MDAAAIGVVANAESLEDDVADADEGDDRVDCAAVFDRFFLFVCQGDDMHMIAGRE